MSAVEKVNFNVTLQPPPRKFAYFFGLIKKLWMDSHEKFTRGGIYLNLDVISFTSRSIGIFFKRIKGKGGHVSTVRNPYQIEIRKPGRQFLDVF